MTQFVSPPVRTEFPQVGNEKLFSRNWVQWFQAVTNALSVTPPVVTGSRGGNAALASLLTALASEGIIEDQTTP